jgi:hypothetical protein
MQPPAPKLTWKDVVDLAFVADFDLLRDQYSLPVESLPEQPWMKPGYREIANRYFKIARAREELKRIYVEAPRLRHWIEAEEGLYRTTIKRLTDEGDAALAQAVADRWARRSRVNAHHQVMLNELETQAGYEGEHGGGGVHRSQMPPQSVHITIDGVAAGAADDYDYERDLDAREDDVEALANALEDP